jgi:CHAT domain-containing protein
LEAVRGALHDKRYNILGDFEREHATKEALLQVRHPTILHIATHGFFFSSQMTAGDMDPLGLEVSLLRSGLLFAGANRTLMHEELSDQADNGIMTSLEVAGLDLHGTTLVALSACETGLGERGSSGEVIGLRRSFHVAGAQKVLVSMWQVDDSATALLMKRFYSTWLNGEDPYQALRHAAQEIRKDYPDKPYFWAAFVLYGP